MVPMRKDQSVRDSPLAVHVKVAVLPGKVEPAMGDRSLGAALAEVVVPKIRKHTLSTRNVPAFDNTFIRFFLPINTKAR